MRKSVGVVLVKGKKVLMQLRDEKPGIVCPGCWSFPGGAVEKGERIKEAAIREFKEETGYDLADPMLLAVEVYEIEGKKIKRHVFVEKYDGKQKIKCFEGRRMEFKSPDEFGAMEIYPGHEKFIRKAVGYLDE